MDLALNNLQRLICHKTQQTKPNQTKQNDAYVHTQHLHTYLISALIQTHIILYIFTSLSMSHILNMSVKEKVLFDKTSIHTLIFCIAYN